MTEATIPAFDAAQFDLPIPVVDGMKADRLRVVVTGTLELDRTNEADLEWFEQFRLGRSVKLTEVLAVCTGKPQTYAPSEDGPGVTTLQATLKITDVKR